MSQGQIVNLKSGNMIRKSGRNQENY